MTGPDDRSPERPNRPHRQVFRRPAVREARVQHLLRRPSLRGEAPTETLPVAAVLKGTPYRDPRVSRSVAEEREAQSAMDLALRVAEVMLRSGAGAPDVETAVVAVAASAGLEQLDIDITVQSVIMQTVTPSGHVITRMRVVRRARDDFARLAAVHDLVGQLTRGEIDPTDALPRIKAIARRRRTWSRWVVALGRGAVSAGVAIGLGAGPVAVALSMVIGVLTELAVEAVQRRGLPAFYVGTAGGLVATILAWLAHVLGRYRVVDLSSTEFAFLVAGGIVALLPSRTIASAMEDLITGYPVTGTARIVGVLFNTFGLIVGVAAGLAATAAVATRLGLNLEPPPIGRMAWASGSPPLVILGAALVGMAAAVTAQSRRRMLLPSAALSTLTVGVAWLLDARGFDRITSAALAAVVLGFVGRYVSLRLTAPPVVLTSPASLGLMPGLSILVALQRLTVERTESAVQLGTHGMFTALGVLMAVATGTVLGSVLASPLDTWVQNRSRRGREARRT